MQFLAWHYSYGVDYFIKSITSTIEWLLHYFSFGLLLKTLFSPWKRMVTIDTSPGFNLSKRLEALSYNAISVVIGFIARVVLIFSGLIFIVVALIGGVTGLVIWLLLPFLSLEVYAKYQKQPQNYAAELWRRAKESKSDYLTVILGSEAGKFLLSHIGLDVMDLQQSKVKTDITFDSLKPTNFASIIHELVESQNVFTEDFLRSKKVTKADFTLAAALWDRIRFEKTEIGAKSLGRPGIALELTFGYTPTLDKYAVDMSSLKNFSHHLIARGDFVARMERVLTSGSNVFLMGLPGVGKKTTIYEFAHRAATGQFGRDMSFKRVLEFDYNSVLSGTSDINQKKLMLSQMFAEATAAGNIILVIRDIQRLTNREVEGYDFTDIIEEHLEKRKLKLIALLSNSDYERFVFPNTRLTRYFEKVEITQPTKEEAMDILLAAATKWETISKLVITIPSLRQILDQSDKYISETPFPEKALELLDSIVTYKEQKGGGQITPEDVNAVMSEKTGISLMKMTESEGKKLASIEDLIHERLINQESAVSLIGKTLRAKTIGVVKEDKPLGSFLFLGPTGVGKTETARVLAKVYYGSEDTISRFDMAEYSGGESIERLIGSVARNLPGALTTQIKNKPASLLLLDELEKADKQIINLFLTLLDEGYLLDAFGKKANGRHLFIIGTSNAGAEYIRKLIAEGVKGDELQKKVVNHILEERIFSPEFLNRFDGVVVYEPLTHEHLLKVADIMLKELANNLRSKNIKLLYTPEVVEKLATDGFDPAFGARPMKRLINLFLGDLIGKSILEGVTKEGDTIKLLPGGKKDEFVVEKVLSAS